MKALLGPTNFANQPLTLSRALRACGVDAQHVLYAWNARSLEFGLDTDRVVSPDRRNWLSVQLSVLEWALQEGFEIFHLWNRPLIGPPGGIDFFTGLDLPVIRAGGARTIYRFTGYDLRRRSLDMELNPYSPFHSGFEMPFSEQQQAEHLEHLRQWTDCFVVQDPEMQTFLPDAEVIPRAVDLGAYAYEGATVAAEPLIVHAPSNPELKGTAHVTSAIEALQARGLKFTFELITGMTHTRALEIYRRADIIVDQLLIGWYGVLAVEGMALGKPVVAYVREPLYSDFQPALPIVNATPETLADTLAELIANPALRVELGERGRLFAEEVHDIRAVAARTAALYDRVAGSAEPGERRPVSVAYLQGRATELEALLERGRGGGRRARRAAAPAGGTKAAGAKAALSELEESAEARLLERLSEIEQRAQPFRRTSARLDAVREPPGG